MMISNLNNNAKEGAPAIVRFAEDAEQFQFLITCIRNTTNGKIDFLDVAKELKIVSREAAQKRYHRMMQKNGIMTAQGGGTRYVAPRKQKRFTPETAIGRENAAPPACTPNAALMDINPNYFLNTWENNDPAFYPNDPNCSTYLNPYEQQQQQQQVQPPLCEIPTNIANVPHPQPKTGVFVPKIRVRKQKVQKPGQPPRKRGRPRKYPLPEAAQQQQVDKDTIVVKTEFDMDAQIPEGFIIPKEEDDEEASNVFMAPPHVPHAAEILPEIPLICS